MADLFDFQFERLRPGQRDAYSILSSRTEKREPYTSIVLPTRYGKSDLMRIGAIQFKKHGLISLAFGLSPGTPLTEQLGAHSKWIECIERYELPRASRHRTVTKPETNYAVNGESFLCATLQLVIWHIDEFAAAAAAIKRAAGAPALFFIDECHFTSDKNTWGEGACKLADAGALVVLMTATAIRDDGCTPVGFRTEQTTERERARRVVPRKSATPGKTEMHVFRGNEINTYIVPDHETTFGEAWEENPSPLCKVDYSPFDVYLSKTDMPPGRIEAKDWSEARISEMNPTEVDKYLGHCCRSQTVIDAGVDRMLRLLRERRRVEDPRIAAIVFCDKDRADDDGNREINRWANSIASAIRKHEEGKHLDVVIATAARDDGSDKDKKGMSGNDLIAGFVSGSGDILIVKQMGGAGLDCSRIKIVLDLSPVRTLAMWVQRIMRAATPHKGHRTCTLITPDDCKSRSFFEDMVELQGGSTHFEGELVDTYEVDTKEREYLHVVGTGDAPFRDNDGNLGEAEEYERVRQMKAALPVLQLLVTDAELAQAMPDIQRASNAKKINVFDLDKEVRKLRRECNDVAHAVTMERLGGHYEQTQYSEEIKRVWWNVRYQTNSKSKLEDITDIMVLYAIKEALRAMLRPSPRTA